MVCTMEKVLEALDAKLITLKQNINDLSSQVKDFKVEMEEVKILLKELKPEVTLNSKEKTAFRKTSKWKNWCKYLKAKRGLKCECCGTETKRLSVHHMDEAHYTDLKEQKFVLVCSCCHKNITRLERIKTENWYKYNPQWVAFYSRFLIREDTNNETKRT